jgi:predicted nucleic acid-binding Zn ribbon protein
MAMQITCEVCAKPFNRADTGRPRRYCSDRCKEKAKRKRERERDRAAVSGLDGAPVDYDAGAAPLCHVCGRERAAVGVPTPLLCASCARAA